MSEAAQRQVGGRAARRRVALVDAATDLFLEVGYGSASMDEVVRRGGGSKATLYALFPSKERLFEAVVSHAVGDVVLSLKELELDALPLREALREIGQQLCRLVLSDLHIGLARLVISEAPRFPELGRFYYRFGPALAYSELNAFLRSRREKGEIGVVDVGLASERFAAMLLHRRFLERLCGQQPQAENHVRGVVNDFLGLYGRGPVS